MLPPIQLREEEVDVHRDTGDHSPERYVFLGFRIRRLIVFMEALSPPTIIYRDAIVSINIFLFTAYVCYMPGILS